MFSVLNKRVFISIISTCSTSLLELQDFEHVRFDFCRRHQKTPIAADVLNDGYGLTEAGSSPTCLCETSTAKVSELAVFTDDEEFDDERDWLDFEVYKSRLASDI